MVVNKYLAEFLGTFVLVFFGSMGILSVGGAVGAAEIVAISFAFGLALLAGIWAVAHISGAHFNPAVTLAMLVDGRTTFGDAIGYWVAQFAGATVASLVVMAASSREAVAGTVTGYETLSTGILMEIVLTLVFVWVILAVTRTGGNHAPVGIALTLVAVHLGRDPVFRGIGEPCSIVWAGGCLRGIRPTLGLHRLPSGRRSRLLRLLPVVSARGGGARDHRYHPGDRKLTSGEERVFSQIFETHHPSGGQRPVPGALDHRIEVTLLGIVFAVG